MIFSQAFNKIIKEEMATIHLLEINIVNKFQTRKKRKLLN